MRRTIETLTFDLVDDICLAVRCGRVSLADLPQMTTRSLGALLELAHSLPIETGDQSWLVDERFQPILNARSNGGRRYQEGDIHLGYVAVSDFLKDETVETDFYNRARRAAEFAGFGKSDAAQFVAAIVELYNNIFEHSRAVQSAYVAFAAYENCFEFVVADAGVGVLQSLKSSSLYSSLGDDGSALELALTEGVSRHDKEPDRGRGFRPILVGLANLSEKLRFRSGDHAREMERLSDGSIPAVTRQKSELSGFFCSVSCVVQ